MKSPNRTIFASGRLGLLHKLYLSGDVSARRLSPKVSGLGDPTLIRERNECQRRLSPKRSGLRDPTILYVYMHICNNSTYY